MGLIISRKSHSCLQLQTTVASFTKEVNPRLAKRPLKINGRLANRGLTLLVREATERFLSDAGTIDEAKRQTITWTQTGLFSIEPVGIYLNEIWIKMQQYSLRFSQW